MGKIQSAQLFRQKVTLSFVLEILGKHLSLQTFVLCRDILCVFAGAPSRYICITDSSVCNYSEREHREFPSFPFWPFHKASSICFFLSSMLHLSPVNSYSSNFSSKIHLYGTGNFNFLLFSKCSAALCIWLLTCTCYHILYHKHPVGQGFVYNRYSDINEVQWFQFPYLLF